MGRKDVERLGVKNAGSGVQVVSELYETALAIVKKLE